MRSMNNSNSLVINYLKRVSYRINYTYFSYLWSWWEYIHLFPYLIDNQFIKYYSLHHNVTFSAHLSNILHLNRCKDIKNFYIILTLYFHLYLFNKGL